MSLRQRNSLIVTLVLLGLPAAAESQTVTELTVSPDTLRLTAGQRQGLAVQAFDDAGNAVLDIRYRSSDTLIARVADNGTVTALAGGRARLVVEAGARSKTIFVVVAGPTAPPVRTAARPAPTPPPAVVAPAPAVPVVAVAVVAADVPAPPTAALPAFTQLSSEPAQLELLPTEHGRVQLRAVRADGSVSVPERVIWRSSRPEIVAVSDSLGGLRAMSSGQAMIQAIIPGGPSVTVPVSVELSTMGSSRQRLILSPDAGDTVAIVVPGQGGRRLRPQDLVWATTDESVLEVRADGFVRARAAGRAEVIVRGFLQEVRVPVIVHQPVAWFAVAPRLSDTLRVPVETQREFTLIPQTADSLPVEGVPITWAVRDSAIAAFDPASGMLTARRAGVTTLSFSAPGFLPKGWTIEVLPGAIALDRSRVALSGGERLKLSPRFIDQAGKPVGPATGVSWVTSNAGVVRVDAEGTVEGVAPGRATITARAGNGAPATATVFVAADLLVTSTRSGRLGVYAIMARTPEQFIPLLADTAVNHLDAAYSPDRTRIAYASDRFGTGNYDVFVADADGRNPVRLTTDPGMDLDPRWTPDGRTLVFVSARGAVRQLYAMNLDGTGLRPLTALPGGADEPAISPDGRSVAFTGYPGRREEPSDILVVPFDGGAPRAVTATRDRRESRPVYLPSGELVWVLHRKDRREPDQVLRQPPAGGGPATLLLSDDLSLHDVALARDGSRIAWVASRTADRNSTALEFTLQWRSLPGGVETSIRLLPGERITSPTF